MPSCPPPGQSHINEAVHSLDITDPMREAAMRGQPLWRRAGPPS